MIMKSHVATRVPLRASAPNVTSVAGLPLSKQQRHRPKCDLGRHEPQFWQTTWQFPVPTNYSLFRQRKIPDTKRTGNLSQAFQIFRRFRIRQRQNNPKQTQIRENSLLFSLFSGNS
jgi:hypothetical protein